MSQYSTGSVRIKVGSSRVRGNSTQFLTYVNVGDLFKLTDEATFYEVAGITNATVLTLTARYGNSSYQTARLGESTGTVVVGTQLYSGTLNNNPVIQQTLSLNASLDTLRDTGGAGILVGVASPSGNIGTIDYDTGVWTINIQASIFNATNLGASHVITASYFSGDTRNSMPYQIFTDYTPHKRFPEISTNTVNFQHIYTKAIRLVDQAFYKESVRSVATNYSATSTDKYIMVGGSAVPRVVTLPPSSYANKGRIIGIINNTGSNITATVNATPALIHDTVSTSLKAKYESKTFVLATSNLWIKIN